MGEEERKPTNHIQCQGCSRSMSSKFEYEFQRIISNSITTRGTVNQKLTNSTNEIKNLKFCFSCSKLFSLQGNGPVESYSETPHVTIQVCNIRISNEEAEEMSIDELESYEKEEAFKACTKNPGHKDFIPVTELTVEKLPLGVQNENILKCIRLMIPLTVLLSRVWKDENNKLNRSYGSGSVYISESKPNYQSCPCKVCQESKSTPKDFRCIWVTTALHVVENDEEAAATTVVLNYDEKDDPNNLRIVLNGHRLVKSDEKADRCILECITHDISLYDRILELRRHVRELEQSLKKEYRENCPNLAVIISHPHGMFKRVSIGSIKEKFIVSNEPDNFNRTSYKHNVPTCKGSSGSVVWILGFERVGYMDAGITDHTHSQGADGNVNSSGQGLERDFPSVTNIEVHNYTPCHGLLNSGRIAE